MPCNVVPPVVVRVDIDHMKHAIAAAFNPKIIAEQLDAQLDEAFKKFDWDGAVAQAVEEVLQQSVQSYFGTGIGRQTIYEGVANVLTVALREHLASGAKTEPGTCMLCKSPLDAAQPFVQRPSGGRVHLACHSRSIYDD